jgi:hypothetical protein
MRFWLLWQCGFWISGVAAVLYLSTWTVMAWKPSRVLLGGVETLWMRCLIRAIYAGLCLVALGALDAIATDILFWR